MGEERSERRPGRRRSEDEIRQQVAELVNRGAGLLHAGLPAQAIPLLERALELDPDNVSAAINLGGAYILAGEHRRAVPILERACALEPDNPMVWTNLGAAYLDRPPFMTEEGERKAIAAFERALALNPATPHVSYNLGLIYKDRGELETALEHFTNAIRANPLDRDARYWCERLQEELRRRENSDQPPASEESAEE